MTAEKTRAIVIRVVEFSESSCIVTLFTEHFGKIGALAKGARRPKGPFESAIDLLAVCRIVFLHKSTDALDLLTEAKLERRFRVADRSLKHLYAGYYVAELLHSLTDEADPHPELFHEAERILQYLERQQDVATGILRFELTALRLLGHLPSWNQCVGCGRPVDLVRELRDLNNFEHQNKQDQPADQGSPDEIVLEETSDAEQAVGSVSTDRSTDTRSDPGPRPEGVVENVTNRDETHRQPESARADTGPVARGQAEPMQTDNNRQGRAADPSARPDRVSFGHLAGGTLCGRCRSGQRQIVSVTRTALAVLHQFSNESLDWEQRSLPPAIRGEIRGIMNHYLANLLGKRPRMHRYLGILAT